MHAAIAGAQQNPAATPALLPNPYGASGEPLLLALMVLLLLLLLLLLLCAASLSCMHC